LKAKRHEVTPGLLGALKPGVWSSEFN